MEKMYRLKKEAVPYFLEKYSTAIHRLDTWESLQVDKVALEVVEPAFIEYGHSHKLSSGLESGSLGGWGQKDGAHFHFTIKFPSMKYPEYDHFSNGKVTRKLMDEIQKQINYFYQDFINEEGE